MAHLKIQELLSSHGIVKTISISVGGLVEMVHESRVGVGLLGRRPGGLRLSRGRARCGGPDKFGAVEEESLLFVFIHGAKQGTLVAWVGIETEETTIHHVRRCEAGHFKVSSIIGVIRQGSRRNIIRQGSLIKVLLKLTDVGIFGEEVVAGFRTGALP